MTSSKNAKTFSHYEVIAKKPKIQNFPIFLIETRRLSGDWVFEELPSSSNWRVMARDVAATMLAGAGVKKMLIIWKFPKSIAGRVFETPALITKLNSSVSDTT